MKDRFASTHDPGWYLRLVNLAEDSTAAPLWSPEELREIWTHQLDASITRCIEELSLVDALQCQSICAAAEPPITAIRDLFARPDPPLELLRMLAKWMQRTLGDTEEVLPREISVAMYNLAIVLARSRCGAQLINSSDADLARRAAAVAERAWLDDDTRSLMHSAAAQLGGAAFERSS
ncbi:hypothetical protein BH09PLA1_BH09PLA1_23170 [soil metagenome]